MHKVVRILALCLPLIVVAAGPALASSEGASRAHIVKHAQAPWDAVGQLNIAGYRQRSQCTAVLIAPTMVLTAAHCVIDPHTGKTRSLRNINFVAAKRNDQPMQHAKAQCVKLLQDLTPAGVAKGKPDPRTDIALVELTGPIDRAPAVPLARNDAPSKARLMHGSFLSQRKYLLTADLNCRLLGKQHGLWVTDCNASKGSSGGPIFQRDGREDRLAAIIVGILPDQRTIAAPIAIWRSLIESGNC